MNQDSSVTPDMKILLVENSLTARMVLTRQLQGQGYHIDTVASGLEAVKAVETANYDLVIMDVFLPEMNGYEAAQHIRASKKNKANLIIVALTSSTNDKDKSICLNAGMNDYIIKSENNEALLEKLAHYRSQLT